MNALISNEPVINAGAKRKALRYLFCNRLKILICGNNFILFVSGNHVAGIDDAKVK